MPGAEPGFTQLVRWGLRKDELCKSIRSCPDATDFTCRECDHRWTPPDPGRPGACPSCGATEQPQPERCEACVAGKYLAALTSTPAGDLLMRVLDLDAALQLRMHVSMDDVLADEFHGLKILQYERNEKQREDMERERREQEMRQRRQGGHPFLQGKSNPRQGHAQ